MSFTHEQLLYEHFLSVTKSYLSQPPFQYMLQHFSPIWFSADGVLNWYSRLSYKPGIQEVCDFFYIEYSKG